MGRSVADVLEYIGPAEMVDWKAFYGLWPWGPDIDDFRTNMICKQIVNAAGGWKDRKAQLEDFIPPRMRTGKGMFAISDPEEMRAIFEAYGT